MKPIFERYRYIIPEFSHFQECLHKPFPIHIRINRLKAEPHLTVNSLRKEGVHIKRSIEWDDTLYAVQGSRSPGNLLEYFTGHIHPQALTSSLVSKALAPEKGSFVLDMCAAPGGKTSHVAQLMNNTGLIIANELYPSRQIPLGHTIDRLGVLNTAIAGYQAQEFPLNQRFDFVLVDAPCSGEGRFRKTGNGSSYREIVGRARLPELQKKIISRGFDLLKAGGKMLYATCTYNPEENESVVDFLLRHQNAEMLPIHLNLDYDPGILEWGHERYDKRLEKAVRIYPHRIDSVGFFMARIGKGG